MTYIIIILIILFIIIVVIFSLLYTLIELLKALFLGIVGFIRKHKYLTGSIVAVLICLGKGGWGTAIGAVVLSVVIWYAFLKIKAIRNRLRANHLKEFERWLVRHAMQLGQTSAQAMLSNNPPIRIPDRFIRYSYPEEVSPSLVIENFLSHCQWTLELCIKESFYEEVHNAGMITEYDVQKALLSRYATATRYVPLTEICAGAATVLEAEHKLDRPTADKKVLHCIGVSSGSQFESEQLDIDIT